MSRKVFLIVASILMVGFGTLVAGVSLYQASISSIYTKIGVGQIDYNEEIDISRAEGMYQSAREKYGECRGVIHIKDSYVLKRLDEDNYEDLFVMAEERLVCGLRDFSRGRVRAGALDAVKSYSYFQKGYVVVSRLCKAGEVSCEDISVRLESAGQYFYELEMITTGRVKDIVYEIGREIDEMVGDLSK